MIQQEINLNMIPHSSPVIVRVDQYDTGTGRIVAHLYDGDTPYTPGAGATAKIQGTKPDKKGFEYNATISTNTVTADLEQQMSCVYGPVRCQFVVTEASGRTGTFAFILSVQQSALEDDTDISETVLPDIIDAAEHNADRAEAAADRAEAASLHYPYIGANKNWYEWDPATEQYIDTGIKAEGSAYNAGLGIDITGDVISVDSDNTPTDGSMKPITSNAVYDGLATKQDNLTAGSFIDITSNVISATYTDATQNDSGLMSAADKTKLDGIESGAEVNVQADWNEADNTKDDYIKNKPTLGTAAAKDATNTIASGSTDLIESGAVYSALNGKQDTLSAGTGIDITSNTVSVDADATPTDGSNKPVTSNGVYDALALKQDSLTFDNTPTDGSTNPVTSDGIYEALALKQDNLSAGTGINITSNTVSIDADATPTDGSSKPVTSNGVYDALALKQDVLTFDNTPTQDSNNPVKSGGVYTALQAKQNDLGLYIDDDGYICQD